MSGEAEWRREFDALRAERETARAEWRSAASGLAARARDPFGLGAAVREHPIAAQGIGAGIGGFVVDWLLRSLLGKRGSGASSKDGGGAPASSAGLDWGAMLRSVAVSVAVPWILRFLKERFGWDGLSGTDAAQGDRPDAAGGAPVSRDGVRPSAVGATSAAGAGSARST